MDNLKYIHEKPFILIVDDVSKNLQVIGNILLEEGCEISLASDGKEALETIKSDKPDLILLDIMMPDLSGYDVCKILKSDDNTKDIPVVFLTARTETDDVVKGFQLGGEDYITKPFKKEELLVRINTHLKLKRSKDIILKQNEKLKNLNSEKTEFMGIAAHDLKNPLNAIKGLAELILMDDEEITIKEIREYAGLIKTSSEYMLQIILDLLNVNAIEEGLISFNKTTFPINHLILLILEKFQHQADVKNIKFNYEQNDETFSVFADRTKTQQILENLISNALKFSPFNKNIRLSVFDQSESNLFRIEVQDEGPGLSKEDLSHLFGKFTRLSAKPTNNEHSTGLGLSIVKKLVEGMNGKIWCESELGKGAKFILELPKK